ncbi:MAG: heme d1 biosynthesis radical SAM protein NirJ [Gammaproteobacteria bacterium]|nr:heme d1 biosynthesis radical SAM protein NirJ [Gammaproteobacteria bacterium]
MFRISRYMHALASGQRVSPTPKPVMMGSGPVVIWNLIRRCNLACKHCYATSADIDFEGELSTEEVFSVMQDLKSFGVSVLILSGGEPLLRPDIFEVSARAREMGFYVGLSSNGTLITEKNISDIERIGYDYVGVSLDGMRQTHDCFRRKQGAFDESLRGIRLCHDVGIKVGLRFTLTQDNAHELPDLLELMRAEDIDKFYLSHLNYAGRGNRNRASDLHHRMTRSAMDLLFKTCWQDVKDGVKREFVTGNNDADGVYLLQWAARHIPEHVEALRKQLLRWGGNSSGVNIANIDNLGTVHPDTMWWDYSIGNVRQRPFSEIWQDTSDPLMAGLKAIQRPLEGRCAKCQHLAICGGNSRTRAWQLTGNPWAEDPGCYLSDAEIGVVNMPQRVELTPYRRKQEAEKELHS